MYFWAGSHTPIGDIPGLDRAACLDMHTEEWSKEREAGKDLEEKSGEGQKRGRGGSSGPEGRRTQGGELHTEAGATWLVSTAWLVTGNFLSTGRGCAGGGGGSMLVSLAKVST